MVQESKKIKILYTIPNFDTAGSGKALLKVAQNLDKKLFAPEILCLHSRGAFFKIVENSGIPVHISQFTTPMKPYWKGLKNCYKISRIFKKINPNIIHSFHYGADYSEPLAAKMAGIKWVYTKKNMNWGGASKNGWKLRSFLATSIIAQNRDMLDEFFRRSKKTCLIPRGVDTKEFYAKPINFALKKILNISDEKRILICVANLVPVKGIEILIKAFSKISKNHSNWILIIVGDNKSKYGISLKNLIIELNVEKKVLFLGKQQNINEYLSMAEVFALPTLNEGRKEGSPVSLLEAMACEKNVLASNISGIKDQLKVFPNHLIESGNIEAWGIALDNIFNNTIELNKEKGRGFRLHVLQKYRIEIEVKKCENLYMSII